MGAEFLPLIVRNLKKRDFHYAQIYIDYLQNAVFKFVSVNDSESFSKNLKKGAGRNL